MKYYLAIFAAIALSSCASAPKGTIYKVSSDPPHTALADVALMEMQALNPESEFHNITVSPDQYAKRNPWTGKGKNSCSFLLEEVTASNEKKLHSVSFISKNHGPWELEEIKDVTEAMRPVIRTVGE